MAIEIFPTVPGPEFSWRWRPVDPAEINVFSPNQAEQRSALSPREFRLYTLPFSLDGTDRTTVVDFLRARRNAIESFFWKEPLNGFFAVTSVACGTGDGIETTFDLPALTDPDYGGMFPIDDANFVGRVAGTPATVSSVDTEGRDFTFSAAPGNGLAVTADFHFYRLVRLVEPPEWAAPGPDFHVVTLQLVEVPA